MGFRKVLLGGKLEVPIACLGTMTWGEQNTEEEAHAQLDYALERGCNFIDTAELYPVPPKAETSSRTESMIGRWLAARQCRDKVIIATKVASNLPGVDRSFVAAVRTDPPQPFEGHPQPRLDEPNIRAALAASLRRLQTDYVDLYQLHWPARYAPVFGKRQYKPECEYDAPSIDEQVRVMGELIKEGKVRHWGLSNETTFGVCQIAEACKRLGVPLPITIQNDFSLLCRQFEEELAEACAPSHYNIHLLAWGALAGGTLTGKYCNGQHPAEGRHTKYPGFQPRYHAPRSMAAATKYAELARSKDLSPTQLALGWCASRWYMGSVIVGATTVAQLKENLDALEKLELDADTLAAVEAVHLDHRNPNLTD